MKYIYLCCIILLAAFIRFYDISSIPHGLYIDEVAIGYNAYTILHYGRDEYGYFLPLFFKSFGDYKMPLYIYLTAFSMLLFGKTEFAVRFGSALFGTATIVIFYLLIKTLLRQNVRIIQKRLHDATSLVGALILTITPWQIQFSRAGFEANVAVFFFILGIYLLLLFYEKRMVLCLILGTLSLIATVYTYDSFRLIAPVTLIVGYLCFYRLLLSYQKTVMQMGIICLVLLLPIVYFTLTQNGLSRFDQTSAFTNIMHISLLQKLYLYPIIYIKNYLSYFTFSYLFNTGDGIGRHTITNIGPLYEWEIPFLLIGTYVTLKHMQTNYAKIVVYLLLISPSAASFARPSPHLLRSLQLVIPLTILVTVGLFYLWQNAQKWMRVSFLGLLIVISYEFLQYLNLYYVHYPMITALDWGGENKQIILQATALQKKYSLIVFNNDIYNPEYIKFYNNNLRYIHVSNAWTIPKKWKRKKILYITSNDPQDQRYIHSIRHTLIENIHLHNMTNDILSQFWQI